MSFDLLPLEVNQHIVTRLTCRSLATVASLDRHWRDYTHVRLQGYKAAIYEIAVNLGNALNLWTPIAQGDCKEAFMTEYLGPSNPGSVKKFFRTLIPAKQASTCLFERILELNLKLKLAKAILLVPPPSDDLMTKHAIVYLRRALNFDHIFYLCPKSASDELKALSKNQVERLIVHPVFFKDPQIKTVFNTHLPAFNALRRVIITTHHLEGEKHGLLLPIIKIFDQVNSITRIDLHCPNLSRYDFYSIHAALRNLHFPVYIDRTTYSKFR